MPCRPPPWMVSGARRPPSRPSTVAPICRRGTAMRSIGRREQLGVAGQHAVERLPGQDPASRRIVVPDPPQSSGAVRLAQPPDALHHHFGRRRAARPSRPGRAPPPASPRQSLAARKLWMRVVPVGQRAEQRGAMRDRFIAGHPHSALQRAAAAANNQRVGPRRRLLIQINSVGSPGARSVGRQGGLVAARRSMSARSPGRPPPGPGGRAPPAGWSAACRASSAPRLPPRGSYRGSPPPPASRPGDHPPACSAAATHPRHRQQIGHMADCGHRRVVPRRLRPPGPRPNRPRQRRRLRQAAGVVRPVGTSTKGAPR